MRSLRVKTPAPIAFRFWDTDSTEASMPLKADAGVAAGAPKMAVAHASGGRPSS